MVVSTAVIRSHPRYPFHPFSIQNSADCQTSFSPSQRHQEYKENRAACHLVANSRETAKRKETTGPMVSDRIFCFAVYRKPMQIVTKRIVIP